MSASRISCPAVTATPDNSRTPSAGRVVIITDTKLLDGVSLGSVKPKSAAVKPSGVSSRVVRVLLVPIGGSSTCGTSKVIVFGVGSVSIPPSAVPPSSFTWKVKFVYPTPYSSGAGVKVRLGISASAISCPADIATPESSRIPSAGKVVIMTD